MNVANSINFITMSLIERFIEMFINVSLNNDLTMITSDFVIYKLLEFK